MLEETKLRLTQPSLAGTWAELGNIFEHVGECNVNHLFDVWACTFTLHLVFFMNNGLSVYLFTFTDTKK